MRSGQDKQVNSSRDESRWRVGWGQHFAFEVVHGPIEMYFWADRTKIAARGLLGGQPGTVGFVRINGNLVDVKRQQTANTGLGG